MRRALHTAALCLALALPVPVLAQTSPGHGVDPARDIILGPADAPLELVIYDSTGCPPCLRHMETSLDELRRVHVDPGALRIVFRTVPIAFRRMDGTSEEERRAAYSLSDVLARNLLCHAENRDGEGYSRALTLLIAARNEALSPVALANWPYLSTDNQNALIGALQRNGGVVIPEFQTCSQAPVNDTFTGAFERNMESLAAVNGGQIAVPAWFLNGERVTPELILDTIARTRLERGLQ